MLKQIFKKALPLLLGLALLGPLFLLKGSAHASNPATINFQGKVVNANGTNEASGTVSRTFVFRLYQNVNISTYNPNTLTCASDSNCVWEESDTLNVTDGVFQVELGAVCPFFASNSCNKSTPLNFNTLNSLSLTMQYNSDSNGFMTPLMHLQSVPYAYNADNLGGIAAANYVQLAQGLQTDSSSSNASIAINKTGGTANIVTLQRSGTTVFALDTNGAVSLTPNGNNIGTVIRQTSGTATSGNIFDIQGANGTSHFIQIAETAANAGSISITSLGSNGVTIDSGSGTLLLGSNTTTLQKSATTLTIDVDSASASTLTVTNNGGGTASLSVQGDVAAGSGHVFKVGSTSGVSESACGANQYSQNPVATGGIITTAGGCAYAVNSVGTFSGTSIANGASITNNQITFGPADGTNPGMVTASGTQTFGGTKNFSGAVNVQNASGLSVGASGVQGVLSLYSGSAATIGTITFASGASYNIVLPAAAATAAGQCLTSTGSNGTLQWLPCGSGSTRTVTLAPEYPGAVMTHNNNSANGSTGTMTSDFCSGSSHLGIPASSNPCSSTQDFNYYSWTETSGTNDYDIWTTWQAPSDFSSVSSITFYGWTTSSTNDAVKLTVYNTGTACGNSTIAANSTSFTSTTVSTSSCTGGSAIAAGSNVILDVDLKVGAASDFARVSNIVIVYNRQ